MYGFPQKTTGPGWTAEPCPCGHRACKSWFVHPVAAVQGVSFTEAEAHAASAALEMLRLLQIWRTLNQWPELQAEIDAVVAKAEGRR